MLKKAILVLLCNFMLHVVYANPTNKDDKDSSKGDNTEKTVTPQNKTRTFNDLDAILGNANFNYKPTSSEFSQEYIQKHFPLDSTANEIINKAKAVMEDLDALQNYVGLISTEDLVTLPVGVKTEIANVNYTLGISEARITPQYTEVTAFVRIVIPQLDAQGNQKQLFFGANKIKISHQGGIYGDANLVLLGDAPIPINGGNAMVVLKGGFDMDTGEIAQQTYVTIDCGGFKELKITADVFFPRTMLEPVDDSYKVIPEGKKEKGKLIDRVKGSFEITVGDWNDIMAEITLPPFQLTKDGSTDGSGKAGLIFELNTAVFDFSDIRNSDSVKFPDAYQHYLIPGNEKLWRGVYVNTLTIILPPQFKKRENERRVVFNAKHLLIDGMGISGNFSAENLLPITEGKASKWQFSVDYMEANFVTNNFTGAAFNGQIVLPLTKELTKEESMDTTTVNTKVLDYDALIDPIKEDYYLRVTTRNNLPFDLFKAKATITKDSYVELRVVEKKFIPKAVLHGNLAIKGSNDTSDPAQGSVDFKGITFQNLQLRAEAPYFQVDYMGYNDEVKFANFPVTISAIEVVANNTKASLKFNLDINLMDRGFSGNTTLKFVGKFTEDNGLHRWKYDRTDISAIGIEGDIGPIQLRGSIDIKNNDPVYGDGFYGTLGATFNGIDVDASAWFGKTEFRYWYVDAFVDLSNMAPQPSLGVLNINGFGGGAYYRMTKKPGEQSAMAPSGNSYIPDGDSGLGFRALLGFSLPEEKAFNGKVGFEMAFNRSGGLNRVLFFGEAHIVKAMDFEFGDKFKDKLAKMEKKSNDLEGNSTMKTLKESNLVEYGKAAFPQDGLTFDTGIDAHFAMEMDFQNNTFHAELEIYVNTPGGFFQGVGPKGRAGWAVFHAAPDEWYIYVGTPEDRIGLKLGIGKFNIQSTSYLMVGDNIPGSPPPPAVVAEILGVELGELDYMRDLNALGKGSGFAFGADFSIDTGDMTFLVFYARFQAGMGFDIMVKNYGTAECKGSGQIGIDGWYANGQAYAYLQGELGIRIKLMFVKKKIPIIKAGAAVIMQAKLPNPTWIKGYLGGHFNLLGGLVKGKFRFKIELGEACELVGGAPLGGLKIISDVKPSDGSSDVDVFTVPQVVFNMRINHPFELEDDNGVKTYRILMDEFKVTKENNPIEGEMEWNENGDLVNFVSSEILPPNSTIRVKVAVIFQEKQGGSWITLQQDGKPAKEEEERTFTTGEAPDYIPITNIVYCYPVIDQSYFYPQEYGMGYVKLERGQAYLFSPETDWSQKIYFENEEGPALKGSVSYSKAKKEVGFTLPDLANEKTYTLRIISSPPKQDGSNSKNDDRYVSQDTGQEGTEIQVRNREAETVVQDEVDIDLLFYDFTTSEHDTFAEKIKRKKPTKHLWDPIYSDVHALQTNVKPSEQFSLEELYGNQYTGHKALVAKEAVLDDAYYTDGIYPLLYKDYPLRPDFTVDRNIGEMGLPPKKAVDILTWYASYLENNISYDLLDIRIPYRYYLPFYYKKDFIDIQYKVVNAYLKNPEQYQTQIQQYNYIINGVFPALWTGKYNVKMQYVLPGDRIGSSAIFTYKNPY